MPTFTQWLPSVTHLSTVLQGSQLFHCVSLSPPRPPSSPPRGFVFSLLQSEEKEYRKVSNGLWWGGRSRTACFAHPHIPVAKAGHVAKPHVSGEGKSLHARPGRGVSIC